VREVNLPDNVGNPSVLLIEGSDFETFPAGGQLSMVRGLMKVFGRQVALVGMSRGDGPIGCWTTKQIGGSSYLFFPVCRRRASAAKPLVPARFTFYLALRRFKRRILSLGCRAAFLQAPEALFAVSRWNLDICYWFAGVENPLQTSRYRFAKRLSQRFDRAWFTALDRASVVLAAADESAIRSLVSRSDGRLSSERVIQFPTRVDTSVFHAISAHSARLELGIPTGCRVFVNPGRISRFKGWELLLDAFEEFLRRDRDSFLFFVGDGEDRSRLEAQISLRALHSRVRVTGFQQQSQVALYINAADVVAFGSFVEGWSVAMLESLACGKAIVSTDVSGAKTMIQPGQNGFIVDGRNPLHFADALEAAFGLADARQVSTSIASRFALTQLGDALANLWPPFRRQTATTHHDDARREAAYSIKG
jgi:glycosyltransferase involved in cell wall biosynthesis